MVIDRMKEIYIRRGRSPHHDIFNEELGVSKECAFVQLFIVQDKEVRKTWRKATHSDLQHHLQTIEEAYKWMKIEIPQLFVANLHPIIISGVAGYGKSFLVMYLTTLWATDQLWGQFTIVLLLECRQLNVLEQLVEKKEMEINSLYDVIVYFYPAMKELDPDTFYHFREKCLLVIDGLDELISLRDILHNLKPTKFKTAMREVFWGTSGFTVLYAGRPESSYLLKLTLEQNMTVTSIQTLGFHPDTVEEFIRNYFDGGSGDEYERLIESLNASPHLLAMTRIPVLLRIICSIYRSEFEVDTARTITHLYIHIIAFLLHKHCRISNGDTSTLRDALMYDLDEERKTILFLLARIAFINQKQGKVAIRLKDVVTNIDKLKLECMIEQLERSGMINVLEINNEIYVIFPHYSYQESLSAIHIFHEGIEYSSLQRMNNFQLTLAFYIGLQGVIDKRENSRFSDFVRSISETPLVEEDKAAQNTAQDVLTQMLNDIPRDREGLLSFEVYNIRATEFMQAFFEYNDSSSGIIKSLEKIKFDVAKMSSLQLVHTSYLLGACVRHNIKINEIHFAYSSNINSKEMLDLFQYTPAAMFVFFNYSPVSITSLQHLTNHMMAKEDRKTQHLELIDCQLTDDHLAAVSELIPYIGNMYIECNYSITQHGLPQIVKSIKTADRSKRNLIDFCVDRQHAEYLKRELREVPFLNIFGR